MLVKALMLALSLMCVLVTTNRKNNLTQDGTQLELKREARVNINRPSFETCPPWEYVETCSSHFLIAALFRLREDQNLVENFPFKGVDIEDPSRMLDLLLIMIFYEEKSGVQVIFHQRSHYLQ